jgi:hypothetical protein
VPLWYFPLLRERCHSITVGRGELAVWEVDQWRAIDGLTKTKPGRMRATQASPFARETEIVTAAS